MDMNYITQVEIVFILGVLAFAGYVFYALDLYKKGR